MYHLLDTNFEHFPERFRVPSQRILDLQNEVKQYGFSRKSLSQMESCALANQSVVQKESSDFFRNINVILAIASEEASMFNDEVDDEPEDQFGLGLAAIDEVVAKSIERTPFFESQMPVREMVDKLQGLFKLVDLLVEIDKGYQKAMEEHEKLKQSKTIVKKIDLEGFYHGQTLALRNIFSSIASLVSVNLSMINQISKQFHSLKPLQDHVQKVAKYFVSQKSFSNEKSLGYRNISFIETDIK